MNQVSWDLVSLVHHYNSKHDSNKLAYTFDAGPNAFLFCQEENVPEILKVGILKVFHFLVDEDILNTHLHIRHHDHFDFPDPQKSVPVR